MVTGGSAATGSGTTGGTGWVVLLQLTATSRPNTDKL